jgi:hypothetical protein
VQKLVAVLLALSTLSACSDPTEGRTGPPSPSPSPTGSVQHPVVYFDLSEEDALGYLANLDERALEALHDGSLGSLHDIYTSDGPARREAAATIVREFERGWVDRTEIEVLETEVLRIGPQMAVFRQVRLLYPCVWTYDDRVDVTPDDRVVRQVLIRYMADEYLNWRLHRDVIRREEPTGERVGACP